MNNNANTGKAAISTALFHIGRRPSRIPEKMKAGTVARKVSVASTTDWLAFAGDGTTHTSPVDAAGIGDASPGEVGKLAG